MHHKPAGRKRLCAEDFQRAFVILSLVAREPNEDGQLPHNLAEALWKKVFGGDRGWDNSRWKAIRDTLADCGFLDLVDESYYYYPDGDKEGRAMRWSLKPEYVYDYDQKDTHTHFSRTRSSARTRTKPSAGGRGGSGQPAKSSRPAATPNWTKSSPAQRPGTAPDARERAFFAEMDRYIAQPYR